MAGLTSGYVGKVIGINGKRSLGRVSLGVLLSALGLKLLVVEDPEGLARIRPRLVRCELPSDRPAGSYVQ